MRRIGAIALLLLASVCPAAAEPLFGGWSGLYLGGHLGGAWGSSEWFDLGAGNIGSHNPSGILGGGQIGYNFQLGPWVMGPQASLSGSSLGGSHLDAIFQFGATTAAATTSSARSPAGRAMPGARYWPMARAARRGRMPAIR